MNELIVPRARTKRLTVIVMVLALAALSICAYLIFKSYQTPATDRYSPVIAALKDHKIPGDVEGRLNLTKQFPGITGHNDAYVTYRDDGSFAVLFPTYYGLGQEVVGLFYTSRPLTDDDTHGRMSAIHFDQKLVHAGSYDSLLLEERINENWYHVSYKLH